MKAVQKIFSFFSGQSNKQTLNQIKEQRITGKLYQKKIGTKLLLVSKEITMCFTHENPSSFDYKLQITNIDHDSDRKYMY